MGGESRFRMEMEAQKEIFAIEGTEGDGRRRKGKGQESILWGGGGWTKAM